MLSLKIVKAPAWLQKGIDVTPLVDTALDRVGEEVERRRGRGLGSRRNIIRRERQMLRQTIRSTRHWPRRTGYAWRVNLRGRASGMWPRVANKYIFQPLKKLWEESNVSP